MIRGLIDKLQLLILSILADFNTTALGIGMTLCEIASAVNDSDDHKYVQITINCKVWAMRELEYVDAKMKTNKADLFYITEKGMELKEVLLGEKRNTEERYSFSMHWCGRCECWSDDEQKGIQDLLCEPCRTGLGFNQ